MSNCQSNIYIYIFPEFGGEYFATKEDNGQRNNSCHLEGYKSVLNSKTTEESMVRQELYIYIYI